MTEIFPIKRGELDKGRTGSKSFIVFKMFVNLLYWLWINPKVYLNPLVFVLRLALPVVLGILGFNGGLSLILYEYSVGKNRIECQ